LPRSLDQYLESGFTQETKESGRLIDLKSPVHSSSKNRPEFGLAGALHCRIRSANSALSFRHGLRLVFCKLCAFVSPKTAPSFSGLLQGKWTKAVGTQPNH
jgi:hypothetical protein